MELVLVWMRKKLAFGPHAAPGTQDSIIIGDMRSPTNRTFWISFFSIWTVFV